MKSTTQVSATNVQLSYHLQVVNHNNLMSLIARLFTVLTVYEASGSFQETYAISNSAELMSQAHTWHVSMHAAGSVEGPCGL